MTHRAIDVERPLLRPVRANRPSLPKPPSTSIRISSNQGIWTRGIASSHYDLAIESKLFAYTIYAKAVASDLLWINRISREFRGGSGDTAWFMFEFSEWTYKAIERLSKIKAIAEIEGKKIPSVQAISTVMRVLYVLQDLPRSRVDRLVAEAGGGIGLYVFSDQGRGRIAVDNDGDAIVSITNLSGIRSISEFDPNDKESLRSALEQFASVI